MRWAAMIALLLAGCTATGPPAPSLTAPVAANARALFAAHDADHDGMLAAAEAAKLALDEADVAALDRDGDGKLSLAEFLDPARLATLETAFSAYAGRWAAATDADGDGRVSRAEYDGATIAPRPGAAARAVPDGAGQAFAAADVDRDGALAPGEVIGLVAWLLEHGWRLAPR